MGPITLGESIDFAKAAFNKLSNEDIEKILGITITELPKKKGNLPLYNVYRDGKLIYTEMQSWQIEAIYRSFGVWCVECLCETAQKEENIEETNKLNDKQKEKAIQYEKEHYFTCPICHGKYLKGTHFHL